MRFNLLTLAVLLFLPLLRDNSGPYMLLGKSRVSPVGINGDGQPFGDERISIAREIPPPGKAAPGKQDSGVEGKSKLVIKMKLSSGLGFDRCVLTKREGENRKVPVKVRRGRICVKYVWNERPRVFTDFRGWPEPRRR